MAKQNSNRRAYEQLVAVLNQMPGITVIDGNYVPVDGQRWWHIRFDASWSGFQALWACRGANWLLDAYVDHPATPLGTLTLESVKQIVDLNCPYYFVLKPVIKPPSSAAVFALADRLLKK
jgi:hypothetical protein